MSESDAAYQQGYTRLVDDIAAAIRARPTGEAARWMIERYTPDDEFVGYGPVHMERMNRHHIWLNLAGESFDLTSKSPITMMPQGNPAPEQPHA